MRFGKLLISLVYVLVALASALFVVGAREARVVNLNRDLADAIVDGDNGRVEAALALGADGNANYDWEHSRIGPWRGLMRIGARAVGHRPGTKHVKPVLQIAIEHSRHDLFDILMAHGARISSRDWRGRTALADAAEDGGEWSVPALLDLGASVTVVDTFGRTPLDCALQSHAQAVVDLLIATGAPIDPLAAALMNDTKALSAALDRGMPADSAASNGRTALSVACGFDNVESVRLLLNHGADVTRRDKDGMTPLMLGLASANPKLSGLLRNTGVRLGPLDAALLNRPDLMRDAIAGGGSLQATDADGRTSLIVTCAFGSEGSARLLLAAGADVNRRDLAGRTPLMWAAGSGNVALTRFLLDHGAKSNDRDADGRTALGWTSVSASPQRTQLANLLDPHATK